MEELIMKLITAFLIGGLIGLERELHFRPAGLRTHMLVILGSTLIMHLNLILNMKYGYDPARMTAQVISGIGFLGAGTILREGSSITGLTTAASLWTAAAIGIAIGMGEYTAAFSVTLFVLLILLAVSIVDEKLKVKKKRMESMHLTLRDGFTFEDLKKVIEESGIDARYVEFVSYIDGLYKVKLSAPISELNNIVELIAPVYLEVKEK